jgi:hypothetical protein
MHGPNVQQSSSTQAEKERPAQTESEERPFFGSVCALFLEDEGEDGNCLFNSSSSHVLERENWIHRNYSEE